MDQVPEGFTLLDPSKLKDPQVMELLEFWYERQEDSQVGVGFQFQEKGLAPLKLQGHEVSILPPSPPMTQRRTKLNKGSRKEVITWQDYIRPDSRRRRKHAAVVPVDEASEGEDFDFSQCDQSSSSELDLDNVEGRRPGLRLRSPREQTTKKSGKGE